MTDQLEFPTIDEAASTAVATTAPEGAVEFEKIDLKKIAIAQFGDWRGKVAAVKAKLSGVVLDLPTQAKVDEAKSLRQREINAPLAEARKVSKALKSRLNTVSADVGAELVLIESNYEAAGLLITPQIEAAEAKLETERQERARIERERVEAHEARLDIFRNVITRAQGLPSERIAAAIAAVEGITVSPVEWEEFAARAEAVKGETLTTLRDMHSKTVEAERIEAQRIENERVAAELEAKRLALEELERKQAAEARRLAAIEEERVARIDARLDNLATKRAYAADQPVTMINAAIMELAAQQPTLDLYGEKLGQGTDDHAEALAHLQAILPISIQREEAEEMARLAAEAAAAAPAPEPQAMVDLTNRASLSQMASEILALDSGPNVIPVAAPVAQIRQPDPAPAPAEEQPTLTLGTINARLGFTVTADFLTGLGFTPTQIKAAKLFRESDFGAICSAIADHALEVAAKKSLEKAA